MFPNKLKISFAIATVFTLAACSNGDGTGSRDSNTGPAIQLDDGEVLGAGSSVIRIPAGDDTGIARVGNTILRQGNLSECAGSFIDDSIVANSLVEACISDQPACAVTFQPLSDVVEVIPPPLYAPIGLEYEITLVDRDGTAAAPVTAVFCFDIGGNEPPVASEDTYQINFASRIERSGVSYNDRCEKRDGSEGVLANDEDDEHITNECLRAELVELPRYASNLSTFANTFRSDGGFIYEAIDSSPPEDADGRTVDSFTYRVTDGVNPVSDPVRVEIVFTNNNRPPVAANDTYTVLEDSEASFFTVLDNDTDPDALPLSITRINNGPGNGVANIRNGVQIEYRPNAGFFGEDLFGYTVVDSGGLTVSANVVVTVQNVNDAPVAQNDTVSTNKNTPIEIRVRDNDSDIEGDTLTVVSVAVPLHGTAEISPSGNVIYTPAFNFSGADSFEYTISDGEDTSVATVVMQVVFVNLAPSAVADELVLAEGSSAEFNILENDSDADGDQLSIVSITPPANGAAVLLRNGNVRYTPNAGFNGTDSFSYVLSDGVEESNGQVSIEVTAVNDLPVAVADAASTVENTAVNIAVLDNDSDPDSDNLTVVSLTAPTSGTAVINADGRGITYTPANDFSGQARFDYAVDDGNGGVASATVTVAISNTNVAPIATDDVVSTEENDAITIAVLANDSDADGDTLTLAIVQAPSNGTALVRNNGAILYTPNTDFSGTDTLTYSVTDPDGLSATATLTINVSSTNAAPIAVDDAASTTEDNQVIIRVLDNDSDPDSDPLSVSIAQMPANGIARGTAAGVIRYTPNAGFGGTDSFIYTVTDPDGLTASATVTVTISNINGAPVAVDDAVSINENVAVVVDVLANDSDPDNDSLTLQIAAPASNGTLALANGGILYTPANDYAGVDQFSYTVTDPSGASDTAIVEVTVSNVNAGPIATDDSVATEENDPISINVLANDSDPDGDALTLTVLTQPAGGTAAVNAQGTRIVYSPVSGFSGADSFTYQVADPDGATATATVSVNVSSVNASPVAVNDTAQAAQGVPENIDVLANDSDPDNDPLTVAIVTGPAGGTATVLPSNSIRYTALTTFAGADSIVYSVDDGSGGTDTATVAITVASVNTAPEASDDTATTDAGAPVTINVLLNDTDADGDSLVLDALTPAANGVVTISNNQAIYTPDPSFSGIDTFGYTASDQNGGTDTAAVTVTVNALNSAPIAADDVAVTDQDTAVLIDVLDNDSDPEGGALTIDAFSAPANGAVAASGTLLEYTPDSGFAGVDSFTYDISDSLGEVATATVDITVNAVAAANVLPVAVDDTATTDQDLSVDIDVLANDSDADGDTLSVTVVTVPASGTAAINADSTITYTPITGFSGSDSFQYTVSDSVTGTATAEVTVTVTAAPATPATASVNASPVAVDDEFIVGVGSNTRLDVLANDSDPDSDPLTLSLDASNPPVNGRLTVTNNGRFLRYRPDAAFVGIDSFGYIVDDGNGGADSAIVNMAILDL